MTHEVAISYTETMVRQAGRRFLMRFAGRDILVGLGMMVLAPAMWLGWGLDWPYAAVLGGAGLVLLLVVVSAGILSVRTALAKFRALRDPTVVWRFSDDFFATRSDLGSVEIRWEAISEVWRFPEAWLLFFGKTAHGYSTLPTACLSPELQEYVLSQVSAHGVKVL